jgi:tetratricopeptide (TPR) repeat protein
MTRLALALLLLATPALAATPVPPVLYDLYAQGRYDEAMRAGEAAHSAMGYALAARAALADAALRAAPCMACLQQAEALARQAVAADPGRADARVWLASALGYQARIKGLIWSKLHGFPAQAKPALDAALAADPGNAFALAALGGWNIEIVKAGGPFLARHLYGANLKDGLALFDRAVARAPGNVAVRYQIALSLAGFDPDAYRARIDAELDAAIRAAPATAYEKAMQGRAATLKALLDGNRAEFDAQVRRFQGYP